MSMWDSDADANLNAYSDAELLREFKQSQLRRDTVSVSLILDELDSRNLLSQAEVDRTRRLMAPTTQPVYALPE